MLIVLKLRLRHWLNGLAISLACWVSVVSAEVLLGTVIAVHDGDSITLENESGQKKIRLAGIDALNLISLTGLNHAQPLEKLFLISRFRLKPLRQTNTDELSAR
jgi:hypothetical protein